MAAFFDFSKQAFNDITGPDELPMLFGEAVEGQTGFLVSLQALDGARVDFLILGHEGSQFLIGFFPAGLVKDGFEFRSNLVMLLLRNVAQYVFHLVLDTALTFGS